MKITLVTGDITFTHKVEFEADGINIGDTIIPFWKIEKIEDYNEAYDGFVYDEDDVRVTDTTFQEDFEPSEELIKPLADELMWNYSIPGELASNIANDILYFGWYNISQDEIQDRIDSYYHVKYGIKDKLQVDLKLVVEDEW